MNRISVNLIHTPRRLLRTGAMLCALIGLAVYAQPGALFTGTQTLPGPATLGETAVSGDFNGDGKLDFVVGTGNNQPDILYLNNGPSGWNRVELPDYYSGAGQFTTAVDMKVGDFDNDNKLDIFVATANERDVIYWNNGNGNWLHAKLGTVTTDAKACDVGFLDGNNRRDIAVATGIGSNHFWYRNDGARNFSTVAFPSTSSIIGGACAVGDFNWDGAIDVYMGSSSGGDDIFEGNGAGGFTRVPRTTSTNARGAVAEVFFGEYGYPGQGADLVVATANSKDVQLYYDYVEIFPGYGNFQYLQKFLDVNPVTSGDRDHVAAGDFNDDGLMDLAMVSRNGTDFLYINDTDFFASNPSLSFAQGESLAGTSSSRALASGDFDGDGDIDLLVATYNSTDFIYVNTLYEPVVGDFDGDGIPDNVDEDDDNDFVDDIYDADPRNPYVCADDDVDGCEDCTQGYYDPYDDGPDQDFDGVCDSGDFDRDGDGINNSFDNNPDNPFICADTDNDTCDDCSLIGYYDPSFDGPDNDLDGMCDSGDTDDDNDMMPDTWESLNGTDPYTADGGDDDDLDGLDNYTEYTTGSDPQDDSVAGQTLGSGVSGGQWQLQFLAQKAQGPGYVGKFRYYTVVRSDVLSNPGTWIPVEGYTDILGNDQFVTVSGLPSNGTSPHIYRLEIELRDN